LLKRYHPDIPKEEHWFLKELVLWGLVESKKLSRVKLADGNSFSDEYSDYLRGMK
jgi:magnesium chelatase subunit I